MKTPSLLKSGICSEAQLASDIFQEWIARIGEGRWHMHRKIWEWCFIAQALQERGLLRPGKRGLVFASGQEPLPSLFASLGCEIVASDLDSESAAQGSWVETGQHADGLDALNKRGLCDAELFRERVSFRVVDMTNIPDDLRDFDFIWSSCSFEHLGSLKAGETFVYNAMKCLKPGGVAVHTTEYNVESNAETLTEGENVIYRKRDIQEIAQHLSSQGHLIEVDYTLGDCPADRYVDRPPFLHNPHLRLELSGFVTTSIGLIIENAARQPNVARKSSLLAPLGFLTLLGGLILTLGRKTKKPR